MPLRNINASTSSKRLFDGLEKDFLDKTFVIEVPGLGIVYFKDEEFNTYQGIDFQEIKENLNKQSFKLLLETGEFKIGSSSDLGYYKTEEHLPLEYFIKNGYLFVFTFGEKQPSRWILVLDGIWKINMMNTKNHEL